MIDYTKAQGATADFSVYDVTCKHQQFRYILSFENMVLVVDIFRYDINFFIHILLNSLELEYVLEEAHSSHSLLMSLVVA